MDDECKGGIHICSSGYDRVGKAIRDLYTMHCNSGGEMKDGICKLDQNMQFILVGSDEFVDSIFDPDLFQDYKHTGPSLKQTGLKDTTGDNPIKLAVDREKKKKIAILKAKIESLKKKIESPHVSASSETFGFLTKDFEKAKARLAKLNGLNTSTDLPQAYKTVFEQEMPKEVTVNTPTGDRLQANRNNRDRHKHKVPEFFPKSTKATRCSITSRSRSSSPSSCPCFKACTISPPMGKGTTTQRRARPTTSSRPTGAGTPSCLGAGFGRCSRTSRKRSTTSRGSGRCTTRWW